MRNKLKMRFEANSQAFETIYLLHVNLKWMSLVAIYNPRRELGHKASSPLPPLSKLTIQ